MKELVTGDAVVLSLQPARPATRALGLGIDVCLQVGLLLLIRVPLRPILAELSPSLNAFISIAGMVLVFVGYATIFETLTRGKSPGKYALGLRVVSDDGGPIRFRQAFVRAMAAATVDFLITLGVVGFTVAMLSDKGKRVGDVLAGTIVVRERAPQTSAAAPEMPAELAGWAAGLELTRLPDELALSVRSFLTRYHELQPAARDALAAQLAAEVAQWVAPDPPAQTSARAYLAAVLAERRRRAMPADAPSASPALPTAAPAPVSTPDGQPEPGGRDGTNGFTAPR